MILYTLPNGTVAFKELHNSEIRLRSVQADLLAALQGAMFFVPIDTKARDNADAAIARATGE